MALDNPSARGANFVPEYQISSIPWAGTGTFTVVAGGRTASITNRAAAAQTVHILTFPHVTRWLQLECTENAGTAITIYFNEIDAANRDTQNGLTIDGGDKTARLPWRLQRIYVHSAESGRNVTFTAGLTTIPGEMLSGSIETFTANHWGPVN